MPGNSRRYPPGLHPAISGLSRCFAKGAMLSCMFPRRTKRGAPTLLTAPSRDLVFPVEIPFDEIKSMDTWEPRSVSADVAKGMAGMVVIVAAMVIAAIVAVRTGDGYP